MGTRGGTGLEQATCPLGSERCTHVSKRGEREAGINEGTWRQHPSTVFWGFIKCKQLPPLITCLHICSLHVLCSASLCFLFYRFLCISANLIQFSFRVFWPLRDIYRRVVLFVGWQRRQQVISTMENKKQVGGSSSSMTFDHLFGPKDPSSASSSSTGIFGSIFPPPSTVFIFSNQPFSVYSYRFFFFFFSQLKSSNMTTKWHINKLYLKKKHVYIYF